ncbi:hypothetical protein EUX98_g3932 [Antrodiella citrinella]|uniref:Haloacid dehalogenase n=1 Tax=Antrodiella citrinella TaxID=2447956 RepID=A0A4S4MWD2_9APHY|nr:hypothetical protein EUX98_g3932 [Antrodiella citrinella]
MDTLTGVEALLFDVFGTVVDWRGSVTDQLSKSASSAGETGYWDAFVVEWRQNYYQQTRNIANGGSGSTNIDVVHREILDSMLESPNWHHLVEGWDDTRRNESVHFWHTLNGWPDTTKGLYALKKRYILGTLSNGSARLLVDMAKHADLPWDIVFSGDIIGSYKPNAKMYLGAAEKLGLPPTKVAMVAAHIYDLRAAASHGMKTVYVRRPTEDQQNDQQKRVKTKADGGEVDIIVDSFTELARGLDLL